MTLSQAVRSTKQSSLSSATKQNLFQKKRKLEKSIEKCKSDYERGEATDRAEQCLKYFTFQEVKKWRLSS